MVPLLLLTLACNIATQLTGSPPSTTTDLTFQSPSQSSVDSSAACNALLADILQAGTSFGSGVNASAILGGDHEVHYLVAYDTDGNDLGSREDLILSDLVEEKLNSRAAHESIWQTFTSLIPAEDRSFVTEFAVLSDGSHNSNSKSKSLAGSKPGDWGHSRGKVEATPGTDSYKYCRI